ncbi:MAG: G1 family glutamic endopeptidase [Candidatus Dormiibacterota bacterium]
MAGAVLLSLGSTLLAGTVAADSLLGARQVHSTSGSIGPRTAAESHFTPLDSSRDFSGPWPSESPGARSARESPTSTSTGASKITNTSDNVGGAYTALPPTRLLDTRTNGETLGPGDSLNLTVTGGSVPADATSVAVNVTVTEGSTESFLSVYPTGGALPLVSNLNWGPGQTIPNLVIVPIGKPGGQVSFYNAFGTVNIVVDLEGYFAPESVGSTLGSYVALTPARITDTRPGSGYPNAGATLGPGTSLSIQVTGQGLVPTAVGDVEAALLNVTVTDTDAASFLTVYPEAGTQPNSSNLNWIPGQTVPNRVVVPVNTTTGQITVFNAFGKADVIVDVDGYFTKGTAPPGAGLYTAITPTRLVDTRSGSGEFGAGETLGPSGVNSEPLASLGSLGSNVTGMVTNVTTTDTTAPSFLTVYPGPSLPNASDLNWTGGRTVANLTIATVDSQGNVSFFNDAGSVDVIADIFGYFSSTATLNDNGYEASINWSGYEEDNGTGVANDTSVSGTLTIPSLYATDSTADAMSEWVGIDGFLNDNQNLIQAGIFEEPNVSPPNTFDLETWWEILPNSAVDVTMSNFPDVTPGDTFTVTITQATSTTWTIYMDDVTQTETFTTTQTYPPPSPPSPTSETSAEWIVEAPELSMGGSPAPLAAYTPTTFTNLSVVGSDSEQSEQALFQGSDFVSVPSGMAEGGTSFNLTYGDTIPYPP